ncbi:MAG: hypothetical protein NTY19_03290 [Planctomycetota bacterium]|nr:hypothetical protein [Planctomycetota bacterium]
MTANGGITVRSLGPITATNVQTLGTSDTNDILQTYGVSGATANLTLGTVAAAGLGDITLIAYGSVVQGSAVIVADTLTVDARSAVTVTTNVRQIAVQTRAVGNVAIIQQGTQTLTVDNTTVMNGSLTISHPSGSVVLANATFASNADANDVTVTASGDILVGWLRVGVYYTNSVDVPAPVGTDAAAGVHSLGDVSLTAGGQVTESGSDAGVDLVADLLTVRSQSGFTGLELAVNQLDATTTAGSIDVHDFDGVGETAAELIVKSAQAAAGSVTIAAENYLEIQQVVATGTGGTARLTSNQGSLTVIQPGTVTALAATGTLTVVLLPTYGGQTVKLKAGVDLDVQDELNVGSGVLQLQATALLTVATPLTATALTVTAGSLGQSLATTVNTLTFTMTGANEDFVASETDAVTLAGGTLNGGQAMVEAGGNVLVSGAISNASTLTISAGGSLANGASASLSVSGNASFTGTSINLGNQSGDAVNFGSLTVSSTGAVQVAANSATQWTGQSTAGSLTLVAAGGITSTAGAMLNVSGNASLTGTAIDVGRQAGDTFHASCLSFSSAGAVQISEDSDTVLCGISTALSLTLTSAGTITNTTTANVTVSNNAALTGTSLTLGNQSGDALHWGSLTFTAGGAVSMSEDDGTLLSGTSTANSLNLTSAGEITNATSASLTIANQATVSGTAIDLGNQSDDVATFGSLTFTSGGAVRISEDSSTQLTGTNTAGSLELSSTAGIVNAVAASLTVTANAAFSGTAIDVGNQSDDAATFGSLTFTSGGAVSISEDSSTQLTGSNTADSLTLSSAAGITNTDSASLSVANTASLAGTAIDLGRQTNDRLNLGSVSFLSGGAVQISEDSSTRLTGLNAAASLDLASTTTTDSNAGTSLSVTGLASLSGTAIDLGNRPSDLLVLGFLTFASGGAVQLSENSSTLLSGTSTANIPRIV